ncbi:DUF3515 domain-containing protein [Streptomyces sp. 4N509B]|uniref:DUF3515 domain-containing protein n=1 Tax=Streptomyces sp. 4N509B TaxID=3457413 RepID=UPI003FD0A4DD
MIATVRRALPVLPTAALALVVLAGCTSGGDTPEVAVPSPDGEAARACRQLSRALPERLAEQERGTLDQETPYAAVWGDPAIVLRCGVDRPAVLTPGSETYNPKADTVDVNGVPWLLEAGEGEVRFTTTDRAVFVEVTVPDDHAPEPAVLTELTEPVDEHVPLDPLYLPPS